MIEDLLFSNIKTFDMATSSITDWISAVSSLLGIPIIIWGIIKIFKKDKDQERKLNSLENLAIAQDEIIRRMTEQITELSKQTSEYQYQSELMKESNNLIRSQIDLQNHVFLHNQDSEAKKLELQRLERISNIKPRFVYNRGDISSHKLTLILKNKGYTAKNLRLKKIEGQYIHFEELNPEVEIEHDSTLEIKGSISSAGRNFDNGQRTYTIDLFFEDIDGNKYMQPIINGNIGNIEKIEE